MINILFSKNTSFVLLFSWFVTIVFAWWFVHPKVDDGIYLIPAISTYQINFPGVNFFDSVEPVFFIFPTQPFLHGIFLKILNFLLIDIDIETYRVFNYICIMTLFYLVYRLFSNIFHDNSYKIFSFNLFLILLGFSQFSLQFYVNRPEIPGLLFFTLGMIYLVKFIKINQKKILNISIFSLSLGITSTFHPNLALIAGLMLIYSSYLIFKNYGIYYLKYMALFFIPVGILIIWIIVNIDSAQGQLVNRVQEVSSISMPGISNIFSTIFWDNNFTFVHNLYLSAYMLTLLLSIVFAIYFIIKGLNSKNTESIFKVFNMLVGFTFILLMIMQPFRPYYLLASFFLIVSVSFFVGTHLSLSNYGKALVQEKSEHLFMPILSLIPLILITLSFPMSHLAKSILSNDIYDNHNNTIKVLEPHLNSKKHIFITTGQLLPLFAKNISNDFYNTRFSKGRNVHWYFPIPDAPGARFKDLMYRDIDKEAHLMKDAIWGALRLTTSFNKDNTISCLKLKGGDFFINLHSPKILYKDRQNIFLTSPRVIPSDRCFQ
jgi:hypothetical protein